MPPIVDHIMLSNRSTKQFTVFYDHPVENKQVPRKIDFVPIKFLLIVVIKSIYSLFLNKEC